MGFSDNSQVSEKRASASFVVIDELVDGLVADGERAVATQGSHNLFWTEVLLQQRDHLLPTVGREVKAAAGSLSSGSGVAVSQISTVPAVDDLLVACNLSTDCTGGAVESSGDGCKG